MVDTPIISLDILATVMEAVGVSAPQSASLDGKSLLPLLRGETTKHHEALFWSDGGSRGEWAVRKGDWKLLAYRSGILKLYNIAQDIQEQNDLARTHPDAVAVLRAKLVAWEKEMNVAKYSGVQ